MLALSTALGCRSFVVEDVVPSPQEGEQDIDDADGVSHLSAPPEMRAAVGIGDVDGDGFDDVLLVADDQGSHGPGFDPDDNEGRVYLVYGRRDPLPGYGGLERAAAAVFTVPNHAANFTVAPLGDSDGDGLPDVGISFHDIHHGPGDGGLPETSVYILAGRHARWSGTIAFEDTTVAVRLQDGCLFAGSAGDVDGDGVPDLWVLAGTTHTPTEPTEFSDLRIFHGPLGRWSLPLDLAAADTVMVDDDPQQEMFAAKSIGDFDGDGVDDLALQSSGNGFGSRVSLFYGSGDRWPAELLLREADAWVSGDAWIFPPSVGDVRGDAHPDLVLVQYFGDELRSPAWVLDGGSGRAVGSIPVEWPEANANETLCLFSLSILGDVDGDGRNDLAGALCRAAPSAEDGLMLAYGWPESKSTLGPSDVAALFRASPDYDWMPPAGIGDFNGDGFDDYVIVTEREGVGQDDPSGIHLVYGAPRE